MEKKAMGFNVGDKVVVNGPNVDERFRGLTGVIRNTNSQRLFLIRRSSRVVEEFNNLDYRYEVKIDRCHTSFYQFWSLGLLSCKHEDIHHMGIVRKYIRKHEF